MDIYLFTELDGTTYEFKYFKYKIVQYKQYITYWLVKNKMFFTSFSD